MQIIEKNINAQFEYMIVFKPLFRSFAGVRDLLEIGKKKKKTNFRGSEICP